MSVPRLRASASAARFVCEVVIRKQSDNRDQRDNHKVAWLEQFPVEHDLPRSDRGRFAKGLCPEAHGHHSENRDDTHSDKVDDIQVEHFCSPMVYVNTVLQVRHATGVLRTVKKITATFY